LLTDIAPGGPIYQIGIAEGAAAPGETVISKEGYDTIKNKVVKAKEILDESGKRMPIHIFLNTLIVTVTDIDFSLDFFLKVH
jgi:hypothetical protein